MKSRKFILFIVEGISDKTSLGAVLNQLCSSHEVQFAITNGDITTRQETTVANIASKLGNIVKDFSGSIFKASDFSQIIHLVDIDGAYIPPDSIKHTDTNKIVYHEHSIDACNPTAIIKRNEKKSQILDKLLTIKKVWKTIPYQVYYFSCNLDHVLYNKANMDREEKMTKAIEFEDIFFDKPDEFINFFTDSPFAVNGNYNTTWEFIKEEVNSLQRFSNFHIYLQS